MVQDFDSNRKLECGTKALDRILGFFPRADGRAQVLLGIDVGMLFTLAINVPPLLGPWWVDCFYVASVLLLIVSLFKIYKVFFPQLSGGTDSLLYFQEIRKLAEREYIDRFTLRSVDQQIADVLGQVWRNSTIIADKFSNLRDAMLYAAAALPFWIFALSSSAVTKGAISWK